MQQSQQDPFKRKPSQLEETLQNFTKATQSSFNQINMNHKEISKNHDAFIKKYGDEDWSIIQPNNCFSRLKLRIHQ